MRKISVRTLFAIGCMSMFLIASLSTAHAATSAYWKFEQSSLTADSVGAYALTGVGTGGSAWQQSDSVPTSLITNPEPGLALNTYSASHALSPERF